MRWNVLVGVLVACLAAGTAHGGGESKPGDMLGPLAPLGERMEKIVDAVIAGRDAKSAAGDWKLDIDRELARKLRAAGAASARLTGYEVDLLLGSKKDVDVVTAVVHATPRSAALLLLSDQAPGAKKDGAIPIDKLTPAQQPFGDVARALLAASKGRGGCARLPMAGEQLLREIAPGPIGEEVKREGTRTSHACAALARGKSPVRIRVEDTLVLVLDRAGNPLGGVDCDLELVDGGVRFRLTGFRPLPP
jgi:hypothetical protein